MGPRASAGAVRKLIASYIGLNPETQAKMIAGEIEVDLALQGTLIERIRVARRADYRPCPARTGRLWP